MGNVGVQVSAFEGKKAEMQSVLDEMKTIRGNVYKLAFFSGTTRSNGPHAANTSRLVSSLSMCLSEMERVVELSMAHLEQISLDIQETD